jgi:hypothetical protein
MANTVIALRQSGATGNTPSLGVLANGELSLNFADGILYYKTAANTLGSIRTTQPAGLTTEVQFNDGGSFGGDSGFTYNKTTKALTVTGNLTSGNISTGGALAVTGNTTLTQGFRALGSVNSIGDLVSNTTFNGVSTRSLNLVGTSAVLRVARTNATGDPAVELLALNPNTAVTLSHWDFYVGGTTDTFSLRRRTGGAEQIILVANNSLANIATNVLVTGNLTAANVTSQSYVQFGDGTRQFTANAEVTSISATPGTYGSNVIIPVFVLAANGRISSVTNTNIRAATTSVNGVVQLNDTITSTSTTEAATANSVKTAYESAAGDALAFAIALG